MRHTYIDQRPSANHWGVSGTIEPTGPRVLVQLGDDQHQVRVAMTATQAEAMAQFLLRQANWARAQERGRNGGQPGATG